MPYPRRVAPKSFAGSDSIQGIIALGASSVTTQTRAVGVLPKNCIITAVKFYGQTATTATALTADVILRTAAGGAGTTVQSAATDIDLTAALLQAGVAASLSATPANLKASKGQLLVVTLTADTCSAGPGDLTVVVEFAPVG